MVSELRKVHATNEAALLRLYDCSDPADDHADEADADAADGGSGLQVLLGMRTDRDADS